MLVSLLRNLIRQSKRSVAEQSDLRSEIKSDRQEQQIFSRELLTDFYRLIHFRAEDNYDHRRYDCEYPDGANQFNIGNHINYMQLYIERVDAFFAVFNLLQDQESRELFRRLILYRLLGHLHVVIREGTSWTTEQQLLEQADRYDRGQSSLDVGGMFGKIHHYESVPATDGSITLDCWIGNIVATTLKRQYFFDRGGIRIAPQANDIVIDAGACFGDTAVYFANAIGSRGHVYAFDPLPVHQSVVELNVAQNQFQDRVTIMPWAVGDKTAFPAQQNISSIPGGNTTAFPGFSLYASNIEFPIITLDDFVKEKKPSRVDFIKMDIEGYELPALMGATQLIERFKPRLAISLYHRPLDFVEIPLWLNAKFPFYDFYLDHYTIHHEETVLYAMPR